MPIGIGEEFVSRAREIGIDVIGHADARLLSEAVRIVS
jgi:hypothetical protein